MRRRPAAGSWDSPVDKKYLMIRMLLLIVMLIVPVTPAVAQDDLQAALDIGYRGGHLFSRLIGTCEASRRGGGFLGRLGAGLLDRLASGFDVLRWGGEYNVTVQTQYGLVAETANRAARHFKPAPTLQDMPLDIRAPLLRVRVTPKGDRDEILGYNMQASIDHIVVGPRENVTAETAVQPVGELISDSVGFQNLFGAALVVPFNTAMASFALEDVLAVTANADLRIYVISPGGSGSWDCDIDADDVRSMAMLP